MADATYQPKFYRKEGGDTAVVASGGSIDVESGGTITNDGTQASHIADVSVTTVAWTTGDKAKVNSILAAMEGVGILATS
jgi:hypothetical protein